METKQLTIREVLDIIKDACEDTCWSKTIFEVEEGKQDKALLSGRRDWIILWEIYGNPNKKPNQQFHLKNYLEFKLHNGLNEDADFMKTCYRYIRNAALILYIREVVFKESKQSLDEIADEVVKYYKNGGKINSACTIAKKNRSDLLKNKVEY